MSHQRCGAQRNRSSYIELRDDSIFHPVPILMTQLHQNHPTIASLVTDEPSPTVTSGVGDTVRCELRARTDRAQTAPRPHVSRLRRSSPERSTGAVRVRSHTRACNPRPRAARGIEGGVWPVRDHPRYLSIVSRSLDQETRSSYERHRNREHAILLIKLALGVVGADRLRQGQLERVHALGPHTNERLANLDIEIGHDRHPRHSHD